ncbi:hypothetical protein [Paraburkholderia sp. ZP32-5]|uniref:hypothetical protein n=1 Tax=Paraburkholderia sp. ZP32-5 TaxID=2883245 RepID=UPI001F18441C|nr:hypothetical protein [Paraburkholderia sp. ZP32-5]
MSSQSYVPYRDCSIEVRVTLAKSHALGGISRRFRVSWSVVLPAQQNREVASFPEQLDFLSEQQAFKYGEKRAHTFIDSVMAAQSPTRLVVEKHESSAV